MGGPGDKKLKAEVERLKAETQKLNESRKSQSELMEKLKAENEKLKERLKKINKNKAGNALWSTKG